MKRKVANFHTPLAALSILLLFLAPLPLSQAKQNNIRKRGHSNFHTHSHEQHHHHHHHGRELVGGVCADGHDKKKHCVSKRNSRCLLDRGAPTCEEIMAIPNHYIGVDGGQWCGQGFWLGPEENSSFPFAIAASELEPIGHSTNTNPKANTHWHGFCKVSDGQGGYNVERIHTHHGRGDSGCDMWNGLLLAACCEEYDEHPLPQVGLFGGAFPEKCLIKNKTLDCKATASLSCLYPAPTCEEIRAVDDVWTKDNGDLCSDGYWLSPGSENNFPISITTSRLHASHDTLDPKFKPDDNTHWHPFCRTEAGIQRINTVETNDPTELWQRTKQMARCEQFPVDQVPQTRFHCTATKDVKVDGVYVNHNRPCISPPPTCAELRQVDDQWGVDNGDLCDRGYWMQPDADLLEKYPIVISASKAHATNDVDAPDAKPEDNTHWHPFCRTSQGIERIHTVNVLPGDAKLRPATVWKRLFVKAGCPANLDNTFSIPTKGLSDPASDEFCILDKAELPEEATPVLVISAITCILYFGAVIFAKHILPDIKKRKQVSPGYKYKETPDTEAGNAVKDIKDNETPDTDAGNAVKDSKDNETPDTDAGNVVKEKRCSVTEANAKVINQLTAKKLEAAASGKLFETETIDAEIRAIMLKKSQAASFVGTHSQASITELCSRMTIPQLVNVAFEIFDIGSDLVFWMELNSQVPKAKHNKEVQENIQLCANLVIVIFGLSLILQVVRWLHIRREFSTPQSKRERNFKVAKFGTLASLVEDVPVLIITLFYLSLRAKLRVDCVAGQTWTPASQLNVAISATAAIWKLLVPFLIKYHFL
jgi:hypothetical protein